MSDRQLMQYHSRDMNNRSVDYC